MITNTQSILGICACVTFAIGVLFFLVYKRKSFKRDKYSIIGYVGKALIGLAILFNAIGNCYGGRLMGEDHLDKD